MSYKVFIDGKAGTAGLELSMLLRDRDDISILEIDEENRKNLDAKLKLVNDSDLTFLCLPDTAAREIADAAPKDARIIDTSTAHRTSEGWTYGMPEIGFREEIKTASRVANPGCHATGFIMAVRPLVECGLASADDPFTATSLTGYSGGGKQMISEYENPKRDLKLDSPAQYALTQQHKHLPEMKKITGLEYEPIFNPYVCDYFQGMTVTVGLHARLLAKKVTARDVWEMMSEHYAGCRFVKVAGFMGEGTLTEQFIPANTLAGTNNMEIFVYGNDDRIMLTSRFDNLGKGASGAAVQCLNIRMGIDEGESL